MIHPSYNPFKIVNRKFNLDRSKTHLMEGAIMSLCASTVKTSKFFGEVSYDATKDKWEISRVLGFFIEYD